MEIECSYSSVFDQKADVLVCPSGPHLKFTQGLAKEISDRAGKRFQMRCNDEKGRVPKMSGFYLFCDAFDLSDQFRGIAPLVCPTYDKKQHKKSLADLYDCIYEFLKTCSTKKV